MFGRLIFFLLAVLASVTLSAQTFSVVGDDDFPPYSFMDDQQQIRGIDIEILGELGKRLGVEFDISLVPFKRLLLMTEQGAAFGSFSLFKTPEREAFGLFTYPVHYSTYRLFTTTDNDIRYDALEDLFGKRIGIAAGFAISDEFDAATERGDITKVEVFNHEDGFKRLLGGGIDGFVGNDVVVQYQLNNEYKDTIDSSKLRMLTKPMKASRGAYFVISKGHQVDKPELWQQRISETLKALEEEGFTAKVVEKYMYGPF